MDTKYERDREVPFLYQHLVAVKFYDEIELPYEDGVERYLIKHYGVPWNEVAELFPGITLRPKFTAVSPEELERLVARARETDPTYEPPNFFTYFVIVAPLDLGEDLDAYILAEMLRQWDIVHYAYVESLPAPGPTVNSTDDSYAGYQGYLEAYAPKDQPPTFGVGARCAWDLPGGDGQGVRFVDVEQGWYPHEDLPNLQLAPLTGIDIELVPDAFLPGNNPEAFRQQQRAHGTNSLGVVSAADNDKGMVGIAPNATVATASIWQQWEEPLNSGTFIYGINIASTILSTLTTLSYGDVMLIEAQIRCEGNPPDCTSNNYEPVELEVANFDAIRLATALGITVVEAAGNGPEDGTAFDLSTRSLHGVHPHEYILNVNNTTSFRDSGAILVGAARNTIPHERLKAGTAPCNIGDDYLPSNYGTRVDCFSWGQCVATTGQPNGELNSYNILFNSTSSAAAIVAGAAVVLQGLATNRPAPSNFRLSPFSLRALLRDKGLNTASDKPDDDLIGVMPNLCRLMSEGLNLTPDVYIRDYVGDMGDPHAGPVAASPDIILRPNTVANPATEFGPATENDVTLGHQAVFGKPNYIYVRVKNRGAAACNVQVKVYWSPSASLVTPDLWQSVGSVTIPTVPSGNTLVVSDPIEWDPVPEAGNYGFVALLGTAHDPAPEPAAFMDFDNYVDFIRRNNNVASRNFNVMPNAPAADADAVEADFLISGPPDRPREMTLTFVAHLPEGARAWLEGPEQELLPLLQATPALIKRSDERVCIDLHPQGTTLFGAVRLDARQQIPVQLRVQIPEAHRNLSYDIVLRQLYEGQEVGRISWRLAPPSPGDEGIVDRVTGYRSRRRLEALLLGFVAGWLLRGWRR